MWIEAAAVYWLFVKILLYTTAILILISGTDDAMVDLIYWVRRLTGHRPFTRLGKKLKTEIMALPEQPIAIMVPAWQEWAVIHKMVELAASSFDYSNYHLFIGTYPNDEKTQAAVDDIARSHEHVHKVVTRNPGPTTKADCLNNVIEFITKFEKENEVHFAIIGYHDAEDVIHPLELKIFNYFIPKYDLIQLPVFPLPRAHRRLIANHYMDEFGEAHCKDMSVREALTGNVPSAGVGTAFSRKAISTLEALNHHQVFDTDSLTEDYLIGFRLHAEGLKEHFALMATPRDKFPYVAVREYFPASIKRAVRQKSRWIVGIVFQGWRTLGWSRKLRLSYILMRDRKAVVTNPTNLAGYFIVVNIVFMELYTGLDDNAWWFPSLIPYNSWLWDLLYINGFFLLNRIVQRFYFTGNLYGWGHGFLSIPRMIIANIVNFMAYFRALRQVKAARRTGDEVAWDKTDHEFPEISVPPGQKQAS